MAAENRLTASCNAMYFVLQSKWSAMQDLENALAEITAIRSETARSVEFRGYGGAAADFAGASL
jgi:hypothetical protein